MLKYNNLRMMHIVMVCIGIFFVLSTSAIVILVNYSMHQESLREAESKARILLDRNLATHMYFSQILKPRLYEWTASLRSKDYFDPSWMSSTYANREIQKYFHSINRFGYYVKDASIDARNPENEADTSEKVFLEKLKKDNNLNSHSAVQIIDGKPYLVILRRGEVIEGSCLQCHSETGGAPTGLLSQYGTEKGFHRKVSDLASVISIRIPLADAYSGASKISRQLSIILVIGLLLLLGVQFLIYRRFLISPIGAIRDKALELARSEEHLGDTIPRPGSRELNELCDAFNEMSKKLRINRDQLEERIDERTSELKTSNEQLGRDIIKRKQAEEENRESEARFRAIFAQAAVGVAEIDMNTGRFFTVNRRLCELVGRTEEEMLATTFQSITHPEDLHLHEEKTALMLAGKIGYYSLEKRYLRKDEEIIWVNITVSPLWKPGENLERNIAVVEDITDRKRMKEESDRYSRQLAMLHETSVKFMAELNLDVLLQSIAQHALTLIGGKSCNCFIYRPELDLMELVATAGDDLAHSGKMRRRGEGAVGQVLATGAPLLIKDYHTWPGRKKEYDHLPARTLVLMPVRWGEVFLGVLNMLAYTPHRYTEADMDMLALFAAQAAIAIHNTQLYGRIKLELAERKQAEEENQSLVERLRRSEKMEALGQLAGGVAHDLNNVLGILSGYSELLLEEIPEGSRSRGHVEKILQSTEKGAAIIQDLLTLARRGVTASDVINLNGVVSGFFKSPVLEKMKDYHPRVTFRTECDKNLLNIKGSPVHLEKTLMNLVSNAAEAITGEGEVTIRTESRYLDTPVRGYEEIKHGDYAVLTVSDTGMGIPAENREKIFEPFYTKRTMGRSGTGLGLAIVWGTVKDHNGYIDIQTEVGEGTTFTLYFPVTREEMIEPQQKEPIERYMGNGESVLVVDDIAEQRDIASRLLTRLGYQVHLVSGGEEAVEYLKENKADILVLDMIMTPGIDGLETYQKVLEIKPKQKAIIVSGFSETDRAKETQKLGAGAYVKKPYMLEKIGVAIRDELLKVTDGNQ